MVFRSRRTRKWGRGWAWVPNALTLTRLILVAPTLVCILTGWTSAALVLLLIAAVTDVLDGWLARRLHVETRLGALLDPVADKALMSGTFLTLAWIGALPAWLVVLVVGRDVGIVVGAAAFRLSGRPFVPEPSRVSRLNTLAQVVLATVVLLARVMAPLKAVLSFVETALVGAVALTTLVSGIAYAERGLTRWRRDTPSTGTGR